MSSAIANTGNLPLVLVLGLLKSPDLPFNSAAHADMAVSYIMLGWWYATLVQMPLGKTGTGVCGCAGCVRTDTDFLRHTLSC